MRLRTKLPLLLGILALGVTAVWADAIAPEAATPEVSEGSAWEDGYFTGPISFVAAFSDPLLGVGSTASYTLDACAAGTCPSGTTCAEGAGWADAQVESGFGDEVVLDAGSTYPDVAAVSDGWVLVFQSGDGEREIEGITVGADGVAGTSLTVSDLTGDNRQARVAARADGSFAVAWVGPDDDDLGVYVRAFDAAGAPRGAGTPVNDETDGRQHQPVLAGTDDGYVVAYTGGWNPSDGDAFDQDRNGLDLLVRAIDTSGGVVSDEEALPLDDSQNETWAAVATLPGEGALVGWKAYEGQPPDVTDTELAARTVDGVGAAGSSALVSDASIEEARHLALTTTADGATVAAAWEAEEDGQRVSFVRLFDNSLVPLGEPLRVDAAGTDDQLRPSVAFIDDDTLFVTWAQVSDSGAGAVMGGFVDVSDGATLLDPFRIDEDDGAVEVVAAPRVAATPEGALLVTWNERYDDPDDPGAVHYRVLSPAGSLVAEDVPHGDADIDVQFRWVDGAGTERCSPVRSWTWADPDAGSAATVTYLDGYTNATEGTVDGVFSPGPDTQFLSLDLWSRTAALSGGACGDWADWSALETGILPATSVTRYPELPDISCVQYEWILTNRARIPYTHGSSAITRVDRVPPTIDDLALAVAGDELTTTLTSSDLHAGIGGATVAIGDAGSMDIEPNGSSVVPGLADGANRTTVTAYDLAGNTDVRQEVVIADLAEPSVTIVSIQDGDVVGEDVPLVYVVEGGVTDLWLDLDGDVGPVEEELLGLDTGAHTLGLYGVAPDGTVVWDEATFTVDPSVLTVRILAPRPAEYEDSTLTAAWFVDDAGASVTLSWDGGATTTDATVTGLADGTHTLTLEAVASDGRTGSDTVTFSVADVLPELEVTSPVDGEVVSTGTPPVSCWAVADTLRWEVDGRSGTFSCGERLPNDGVPLPDGDHTLYVTAENADGNASSVAIDFTVDTRTFDLVVTSPTSGVYTSGDVPLTWTVTADSAVVATLDGAVVTELVDLPAGTHTLEVQGTAETGTVDTERVEFVVSPLEIVSPAQDEQVATSALPPTVPFVYSGGDGCASLTVTVDDGEAQLLTAAPGETTDLVVGRGAHTAWLTCNVGTSTATRVVDFEVGELDIALSQGNISYSYDGCTDDWECDVTVSATLRNLGDFDVTEPFEVRFEHLSPDGTPASAAQVVEADPVVVGDSVRVTFAAVRAGLEDRFSLVVDPEQALAGETRENDYAEVRFLAASLNAPEWVFDESVALLSGSSFNNGVLVTSSGAIDHLRVTSGDLVVVDHTPTTADTWGALVDVGILEPGADCVELAAVTEDGVVADARAWCPEVHTSPLAPSGHDFPWYRYMAGGELDMDTLDRATLADAAVEAVRDTMVTNVAPMLPVINDDGTVSYLLLLMAGEPDDPLEVDLGDAPIGGGEWELPTQTTMFSLLVNPTSGTCSVEGVFLADADAITDAFDAGVEGWVAARIDEELEGDLGALIEEVVPGPTVAAGLPWGTDNFLFAGATPFDFYGLGVYHLGVLDLSLTEPTFTIDTDVSAGFEATMCSVSLGSTSLTTAVDARAFARIDAEVHLYLGAQGLDYFGAMMPSWEWIPIPVFFGFGVASVDIHPQDVQMDGSASFEASISVDALAGELEAASEAEVTIASQHGPTTLFDAHAAYYPVIFAGVGLGAESRGEWTLDAYGHAGATGVYDFDDREMSYPDPNGYARFYIGMDTWTRGQICFLAWCWWGGWAFDTHDSTCMSEGDPAYLPTDPCPCGTTDETCYDPTTSVPL